MTEALLRHTEPDLNADAEGADLRIGRRIRALRLQRGCSLADLAQAAGVSIGALSQIERGLTSLKVRTLWPLAGALGIEPQALVDDSDATPREPHILRRRERRAVPVWSEGIGKELLSPSGATLTGLRVVVEPGGGTAEAYAHAGHEFGLVLRGEMELEVDGVASHLKPGDSFAFESTLPHAFRNSGATACEIVWVNTVQPLAVRNGA